ncbi:hypothetical protein [Dongia sp.]|uniref:hypothetical protein n=1 Tax=Dongia sp. TaxID=1977262 RepID=UPI0034A42251
MRPGFLWLSVIVLAAACSSNASGKVSTGNDSNAIERCSGDIVFKKVSDVPTTANPKGILLHGVLECANQGPRKIDATLDQATTWEVVSPCHIDLAFKPDIGGTVKIACTDGKVATGLMRMYLPGRNGFLDAMTPAGEVIAFAYMLNAP